MRKLACMVQHDFAEKIKLIVKRDPLYEGLAAGGSWITGELDEYSDLDLVLVTNEKIGGEKEKMHVEADRFGRLLTAFTGEHVGEPRLLVCLYDDPLLHVDLKFVTTTEFHHRVEDPVILFERGTTLSSIISSTQPAWPQPDLQWIEDRMWTWVHYMAGKIARGEYYETISSFDFIRVHVLAPMLQLRQGLQVRGMRKLETRLKQSDLNQLGPTLSPNNQSALWKGLQQIINSYRELREGLTSKVEKRTSGEEKAVGYFELLRNTSPE